jgi:hypothetical protein
VLALAGADPPDPGGAVEAGPEAAT